MKPFSALFSAFCLLAFASPTRAHHETGSAYLVFWNGIVPKTGSGTGKTLASPGVWRMAFVSKYPILGAQVPALLP
ncbi:MAG TPA: hypothetical protein VJ385_21955 [Fibrobacteria bacterium]|nr:hypothetical protein [Fibrobacteria bacterium]